MSPTTTKPTSGPTPSTTAFAAVEAGTPRLAWLRGSVQQLLAFASLIVIVAVFSFASPHFFTTNNLVSILTAATVTGILALGTTFVIITGGIDLSIGTAMVLCGVMAGVFLTYLGWPLWAGVAATILFGGLIGLINGVNISVFGIPPFIATLGMMLIAAGLSLAISGTKPIYFTDTPEFQSIMNLSIIPGGLPARRRDLHRHDRRGRSAAVEDDLRPVHVLDPFERGRNRVWVSMCGAGRSSSTRSPGSSSGSRACSAPRVSPRRSRPAAWGSSSRRSPPS